MEKDINEVISELGDNNVVRLYRQLTLNNKSSKPLKDLQKLFVSYASRGVEFYYIAGDGRKVKVKEYVWKSIGNLENLIHKNLFNYIVSSYEDTDLKILYGGMVGGWNLAGARQ